MPSHPIYTLPMIQETFGYPNSFGVPSIDLTKDDDPPRPQYNEGRSDPTDDDDITEEVPFGQIQTKVSPPQSKLSF